MTAGDERTIRSQLVSEDGDAPNPKNVHKWVRTYFEATQSMDAHRWAASFSQHACVDDPVGTPVKKTADQILAMGENFMEPFSEIGLYPSFVHVVGYEAVARWQGRGVTKDGDSVAFDGINLFTFDNDGKIIELRGFFAPPGS